MNSSFLNSRCQSQAPSAEFVKLNVGGKIFNTKRSTLVADPDSLFSKWFPMGAQAVADLCMDEDGAFLIDRDPEYFRLVLLFLRTGEVEIPSPHSLEGLEREAHFFNLQSLLVKIGEKRQEEKQRRQEEEKAKTASNPAVASDLSRRDLVKLIAAKPYPNIDAGYHQIQLHLRGVRFIAIDLSRLDITSADLTLSLISRCDLSGAQISGSLNSASISSSNCIKASIQASFIGAVIKDTDFSGSSFSSQFTNCEFINVRFIECDLSGSMFRKCRFSKVLFCGTKIGDISSCSWVEPPNSTYFAGASHIPSEWEQYIPR